MHGELLEQRLLVAVQEVVAPVDERFQRGAARVGGGAVAQECRASLEDRDELDEPEHVHARGGELDRERQPVHAPRDLGRERDVLGVGLEPGPRRPRALDEKVDGRDLRAARRGRAPRPRRGAPRGSSPGSGARGHSARSVDASRAASSRTCSHASRTRSASASRSREVTRASGSGAANVDGVLRGGGPRRPRRPRARSRRARCRPGSRPPASAPPRRRAGSCRRRAGR